jgi:hypothetical protein
MTASDTMPVAIDGTIRRISYRFIFLPRWTYDLGWVWACSIQTRVIEHPAGCFETRRYGDRQNWFTRSWAARTALRGDCKVFMDFLPTGGRL